MSKTIGFNADDRLKILSDVLASRLGYGSVSEMLRDWLDTGIGENLTEEEQEQILQLYVHKVGAEYKPSFTRSGRRAQNQVAAKD